MKDEETASERRLAENEVLFRETNQQVVKRLDDLKTAEEAEGMNSVMQYADLPLHFYCECSDENCRRRIVLKASEYKAIHQKSNQFVIIPGHAVRAVEHEIARSDNYIIVEKYKMPPPAKAKLNPTPINNN